MTPADAMRFLDHEAVLCRDRDAHEALCLLLPALLRVLELTPMDDFDALAFRIELHKALLRTGDHSESGDQNLPGRETKAHR